ncbi:hypothetical protein GCM10009720_06120 [Yaniella flava]|uniref:HTH tetR-type domain-containing protein n=1 Tax=Yaniella flava TaxID=287930 RepID=A0ABP5FN83_9MICC
MSAITRDELSRIGLQLLADHGLADVSMRRVANEFGVAVSALYWHVKDKQSLLGAMVDRLIDDIELEPATGDWKIDLPVRAEQFYNTLLHTRDAAELAASVLALGTGGDKMREALAEVSPKSVTTDAVMSLLIGHATLNQQRIQAQAIGLEVSAMSTSTFRETLELLM